MDLSVDQKAVELLTKAEALMNDEGRHWGKGNYHRMGVDGDVYCAMGGLYQARELLHLDNIVIVKAQDALARIIGERVWSGGKLTDPHDIIVNWNDDDERTWADVKATFEKAREVLSHA